MTWFWTLLVVLAVMIAGLAIFVSRRDRGRQQATEPAAYGHPVIETPGKRDTGLDGGSI